MLVMLQQASIKFNAQLSFALQVVPVQSALRLDSGGE
jgi:hypothetical protein